MCPLDVRVSGGGGACMQVECLPTCRKEGEEPANPPIKALDYVLTRYRHAKLNVRRCSLIA